MMQALIAADNHWALLAILFASTFLAIFLEQKYQWASKISGAIITLVIAIALVNLGVIPSEAPVFDDFVWGYAVPLAIPLLLLQTDLRRMHREAGRFLAIFLIGAVGTVLGAVLATVLLRGTVEGIPGAAAMMTGSYIGGGVNFTALAAAFNVDANLKASTTVADNLNMAIYFLVLLSVAGSAWFRKRYRHPYIDDVLANGKSDTGETLAACYWAKKETSLKDIALNMTYAVIVVFLSKLIGGFFKDLIPADNWFLKMLNTFFGSEYVWITNLSLIWSTCFSKQASNMRGAQEIGTWLIYLFFFVIGAPASVGVLIRNAPILLAVLFPGRQTVQIRSGGNHPGFQRQYRRPDHGSRYGDLPGLGETDRTLYAGRHLRLCDRYLAGHSGRIAPRRLRTGKEDAHVFG